MLRIVASPQQGSVRRDSGPHVDSKPGQDSGEMLWNSAYDQSYEQVLGMPVKHIIYIGLSHSLSLSFSLSVQIESWHA